MGWIQIASASNVRTFACTTLMVVSSLTMLTSLPAASASSGKGNSSRRAPCCEASALGGILNERSNVVFCRFSASLNCK